MPKKEVIKKNCYCCREVGSFCRSKGQLRPYCNKCYVEYDAKERKRRVNEYIAEIFQEEMEKK